MGQVLHGSAKTTEAMRREIQNSKESISKLLAKYSITKITAAKLRNWHYTCDSKMGLKESISSTILTREEEAMYVALGKDSLLSLSTTVYIPSEKRYRILVNHLYMVVRSREAVSRKMSLLEDQKFETYW